MSQTNIEQKESITETEPILVENPGRFVLFPIQHNKLWEAYKKAESSFWTAEEIDFSKDNLGKPDLSYGWAKLNNEYLNYLH